MIVMITQLFYPMLSNTEVVSMSPKVRRQTLFFGISGGVVAILLALLFLLLTYQDTLYAAPPQVHSAASAQTGIITGQVTAEDSGAPLAGIEVVAFPRAVAGEQQPVYASTDVAGRYKLPSLHAGTYKVCFGPFQIDDRYLSECYDDRPLDADDEQLVTVTEGETLPNINAVLTLGGVIQGRITSGRTGEPLPNIPVYANRIEQSYVRDTWTDANGVYEITALPTGNYRVAFNSGGDANEIYAREYYDDKAAEETSDPVSVTVGITTSGIDSALSFILNITGHIEYEGTYQREGSLKVSVYDDSGTNVSHFLAATNDYTITSLAPGAYRIRFGENEFVNEYYSDSPIFEEATWITVTENVVVSNINVSLVARPGNDLALATASTRPNAILAARVGSFSQIYTLDGGQSWHTFATKPTANFQDVRHIAVAPKDGTEQPMRFLVAPNDFTASATVGIYRSADEGVSWANFNPPPDPQCDAEPINVIEELVSSAADPLRLYLLVRCVKTINGIEPIFHFYFTLYRSSDGGVNWQAVTLPYIENGSSQRAFDEDSLQPSPADPARLYANLQIDISTNVWRRSDNGGQSWITETFTASALALDWTDAAKLYRVEDHGESNVFRYTGKRSTNTGASWEEWPQQPCRTSFLQLITLPTAESLLMLCNQGLYRSSNGGDSWELLTPNTGRTLSVHNGNRDLVLWVRDAELYASRDQGTTWQDLGGWQDAHLPSIYRP